MNKFKLSVQQMPRTRSKTFKSKSKWLRGVSNLNSQSFKNGSKSQYIAYPRRYIAPTYAPSSHGFVCAKSTCFPYHLQAVYQPYCCDILAYDDILNTFCTLSAYLQFVKATLTEPNSCWKVLELLDLSFINLFI